MSTFINISPLTHEEKVNLLKELLDDLDVVVLSTDSGEFINTEIKGNDISVAEYDDKEFGKSDIKKGITVMIRLYN